jgi:hypothetical protein
MKYFIILLLLLTGCSERYYANKALRTIKKDYTKIQTLLQKHPQLVDSLEIVKHDTLVVTVPGAALVVDNDPGKWDSTTIAQVDTAAMGFMAAVDSLHLGWSGTTANTVPTKNLTTGVTRAARALQSKICPHLVKDTVIYVTVRNSVINERVPVRVGVIADGSSIKVYTLLQSFSLPENTPLPLPVFEAPEKSLFADTWFWVAVASWVVTVLVTLTVLKRVKQG